MKISWKKLSLLLSTLCLFGPTVKEASALERCSAYKQGVKVSHYVYFGTDYPYWYSVGQLQQESNCRDVISRDGVGSQGVGQITYRVWKDALQRQGISEIKTTKNHLRAQAYINRSAYNEAKYKKLWVAYQVYNGGGLVNKEIARAGKVDWAEAYKNCRRKTVYFTGGYSENACDINYQYSKHLYKYGELYRTGTDSPLYPYW